MTEEPRSSAAPAGLVEPRPASARTLDVGCGPNKTPGSFGVDRRRYPGVDLVHDLESTPWPLDSNAFARVVCSHIIEHVSDVSSFLREVHRVGIDGAEVCIDTPHFSSLDSWTDPTHRQHLSLRSFDLYADSGYLGQGSVFRVESATLTFRRALSSRLGVLLFRLSSRLYEQNLAYLLPAKDIRVVLRVVKP